MTIDATTGRPPGAPVGLEVHYEISQFLATEAELLDGLRLEEWLSLLTDDVIYTMPARVSTMRDQAGRVAGPIDHFAEDRYSLGKRVQRLSGTHAWTEDPPSRTRRFVTNVRGYATAAEGELVVDSYVLLFRSRLDVRPPEWVSAARRDLLRRERGGLRLAAREITVDESLLRTQNLAVFL